MGVVIINGQKYDSVSGLQIDQPKEKKFQIKEISVARVTSKPRRQSKQERLAEAVAQEFANEPTEEITRKIISEPAKRQVPDWINQFVDRQADIIAQPNWIANYLAGGEPLEIEPIGLEAVAQQQPATSSASTYSRSTLTPQHTRRAPQRSRTLNRDFAKKPSYIAKIKPSFVRRASQQTATKHPDVHRFAPTPIPVPTNNSNAKSTISNKSKSEAPFVPVMTRNMEEKLAQRKAPKVTQTSSDLKKALISEQMNQPIDRKSRLKAERKAARTRRRFTAPTLVTAALAIMVLGGYFTYVSMPSISVRVAAARAGIDAHTPYAPSGYSIDGPVAYAPGRVTINYKSNGGGNGYSLTQETNEWGNDAMSSLVDSNDYTTIESGRTTIYRYGNKAAWISNDILFTLNGNDSLGDDQITRIVESM